MILGGKYQGKLNYVLQLFSLKEEDVAEAQLDKDKKVINNLQDYILSEIREKRSPIESIEKFAEENPNIIFLCNEVGSGLVPIDPIERQYRETVGRACCSLAKRAKRVHRIVCGISSVIKNG